MTDTAEPSASAPGGSARRRALDRLGELETQRDSADPVEFARAWRRPSATATPLWPLASDALAGRDPALIVFGRSFTARALLRLPEYQRIVAALHMPRDEGGAAPP